MCLFCSVNMTSSPPAKVRRPNYTRGEMLCIIHEVKQRRALILGRLNYSAGITNEKKDRAWDEIACAVNVISHVPRTRTEVRAKFKDMRAQCKAKIARNVQHMEGTGSGTPKEIRFTEVDKAIMKLVPTLTATGLPLKDSEDHAIHRGINVALEKPRPSTSATSDPGLFATVVIDDQEQLIPIITDQPIDSSPASTLVPSPASSLSPPVSRGPSRPGSRPRTPASGALCPVAGAQQLSTSNEAIQSSFSSNAGTSGFSDVGVSSEVLTVVEDNERSLDSDDKQSLADLQPLAALQPVAASQPAAVPQPAAALLTATGLQPDAVSQPTAGLQPPAAPQPSPPLAAQQSCSRRRSKTLASGCSELKLLLQVTETQQKMHSSIKDLVLMEQEQGKALLQGVRVQQDLVQALQQIAASHQEITASQKQIALSQQQIALSQQQIAVSQQQIAASQQQSVEIQKEMLRSLRQLMVHATQMFDANHQK